MSVESGDILRTTVNFVLNDGTLYQNVYHHQRTGVTLIPDQDHVDAIEVWAETMYAEIQDQVRLNVIEQLSFVERVAFSEGEWAVVENIGTFTPLFEPQSTTEAYANQVSPFVVAKTNRPRTVGRKFLFPFCETSYDEGVITTLAVADMVAFADDYINDIDLGVFNYLVPGVPRTGVDAWYELMVGVVTNIPGSQRRRRIGVGA